MLAMDYSVQMNPESEIEIWQVSKSGPQPIWVQEAFAKHYFQWLDNRLRILVAGLNKEWWHQSGRYYGQGMYVLAEIGDVVDKTHCRIFTEKQFQKQYGKKA
ncbi:TPA: hypothetical protein ACGO4F_002175 [Streptococcus suis]